MPPMPTCLRPVAAAATIAALVAAAPAVRAEGGLLLIDAPPAQGYTLAVGPTLLAYPESPGSSHTKTMVIPGVDFYSSLGGFASTDIGLGWNFSRRADLQYGLRLFPVFGRDDDDERLRGLEEIGLRLGKAAFLNYAPWEFLILQSSLMVGSGRHGNGLQAEAGATVGAPIGQSTLGLTLGVTWANRAHRDGYFGISPEESTRSGLPAYALGGGWQDLNLALTADVPLTQRWKISGELTGTRLLGDVARSPVSFSRNQTTASVTLWYRFD